MSNSSSSNPVRKHICFVGCTNAGKSSLVNAILGQNSSIVSPVPGTTTDPVNRNMELQPAGPVVITDTAGFDDISELGTKRIAKTRQVIAKADLAVLCIDIQAGISQTDYTLMELIKKNEIPCITVFTKSNAGQTYDPYKLRHLPEFQNIFFADISDSKSITDLKNKIAELILSNEENRSLFEGLVQEGNTIVLVVPVDEGAPKGRLILPQQIAIREILDRNAMAYITKPENLPDLLDGLTNPPDLVVTDSQAFAQVDKSLPKELKLTSFSILMARYNGFLNCALDGIQAVQTLKDGDTVLICESCTHHRQCSDIGTVKIPLLLKKFTGKNLNIKVCAGSDFLDNLEGISLVIHCGGCMTTPKEIKTRMNLAKDQNIPFTNYGIFMAMANGILDRCLIPDN